MNKLVSKNSVQRFKQGRKIVKAADGLKANEFGTEQAYFLGDTGKVFIGNIGSNGKRLTQRYTYKGKQYGSFDEGKTYYELNSNNGGRPLSYKANQQMLAAIERRNKPKVDDTPGGTGGTGGTGINDVGFMGVKRGGPVKDFNDAIKDYKAKLIASGSFYDSDFADTRSFQKALNRYFGKDGYGSIVADNKWGNQTQRAFDEALKKINAPVVNTTEGIKFQGPKPFFTSTPNLNDVPKINVPKPVANFSYRTSNTYENNDFFNKLKAMGIRSNADLIDFMNRTNGENYNWNGDNWAKQFRSDVNQALGGNYSDDNIRKVFNTSGNWHRGFLGRGDLGDFQNALQTYAGTWNGSYDRNLGNYVKNIDWTKFKLFKQGGQLSSRNVVERFKQKNFR